MFARRNAYIQGCFNRKKTWREHRSNKMPLTLRCTWVQLAHNALPLFSLFIPLYSSVSLTHIVAPLCSFALSPFRMRPWWGPSLGSRAKQRRWCYLNAARRLSARIGPGWPSGRLADARPCQAPSACPPRTSAVCGKAVEFVCGCILILHLFGSSHAWSSKPAAQLALLVLIALAWLAVCFWLQSLISIPQEATTTVAAFTHTHTYTQTCTPHVHEEVSVNAYLYGHNYSFFCMIWNSENSFLFCFFGPSMFYLFGTSP